MTTTVELGAADFESTVTTNDIVFGKVDTEEQRELSAAAGISSIPTLTAFRDGMWSSPSPGPCQRRPWSR